MPQDPVAAHAHVLVIDARGVVPQVEPGDGPLPETVLESADAVVPPAPALFPLFPPFPPPLSASAAGTTTIAVTSNANRAMRPTGEFLVTSIDLLLLGVS